MAKICKYKERSISMKKILLMCMGGFSTGLLVEKMKEAARNSNEEVEITAIGSTSLDEVVKDYDILLLAPQINYIAAEVEKKYPDLPNATKIRI